MTYFQLYESMRAASSPPLETGVPESSFLLNPVLAAQRARSAAPLAQVIPIGPRLANQREPRLRQVAGSRGR